MEKLKDMHQLTPMMQQYLRIKQEKPDVILFFRLGDFYEMFFEDAKIASKILNLTLTSREAGKNNRVPMCGVPYHAAETYISKLIQAGKKVAICEQIEDPKLAKGLVKREVIRTITPGTVLTTTLLEDKTHNYLVSINKSNKKIGFAFIEPSTGEFKVTEFTKDTDMISELTRLLPKECLIPESLKEDNTLTMIAKDISMSITLQADWVFTEDTAKEILCELFGTTTLDGFGCTHLTAGIGAAGAIIQYLKDTQQSELNHIIRIIPYSTSDFMTIDTATWRNLELTQTIRTGEKTGTLIWVLDKTVTAMGGRMLRTWIYQPLIKPQDIIYRQEGIEIFYKNSTLRKELLQLLKDIHDLIRLTSRIDAELANARDLIALKESLLVIPRIKKLLSEYTSINIINDIFNNLDEMKDIVVLIDNSITNNPPISLREGGIIRSGYNQELDELYKITQDVGNWLIKLQQQEINRTGITSLKIGYNKVFGYYIEVTKPNLHLVPKHYIRKQTLANAERFITPELKEKETQILNAKDRINELEYNLFLEIRAQITKKIDRIQQVGNAIALLDVLLSLAHVAIENNYVKPIVNTEDIISIKDGRHPVVEKVLSEERFVPNDTFLDLKDNQILVITGPNMAGKSTYIRQVALIVLMAQIGSFVPAREATIGVVDKIFSRVGASDELIKGQSTFMVEMIETANILNNSTPKSLIVLDEIGRGTSTFDGVSIAWAVAEYIHNHEPTRARTLFATHYHELTELELLLERVKNYQVLVKEWNDRIIFLRKIVPGNTDKSYGIHVARLAGLPEIVIKRAGEILSKLEMESITKDGKPKIGETTTYVKGKKKKYYPTTNIFELACKHMNNNKVIEEIKHLDINTLTPIDALNKLYELKKMI
jgi:DNA mismatch repair protein MutS